MNQQIKTSRIKIGSVGPIDIQIPIIKIGQGKPVISLISGLHGNEDTGTLILERLFQKIKNWPQINGTIKIIPFANPLCLINNSRELPTDNKDLNRLFPGNKKGTLSERIAYYLFQAVKDSNLLIDFHTFPKMDLLITGILVPIDKKDKLMTKTQKFLYLFNPDFIWKLDTQGEDIDKKGSLIELLLIRNNIAFALELPLIDKISSDQIKKILRGISVVVRNTITDKFYRTVNKVPIINRKIVTSPISGLFIPLKKTGENIQVNIPFGKIVSLETLDSEKVKTPIAGQIIMISEPNIVKTGDKILALGQTAGKEKKGVG
ncbi:MAG TPA: succinylglutamate desuccinylase/aspartoacylase family protein [Candidatus Bathyarchaeia archaeon]|nr:succinylglutamate desuccinylase/aspartoacylase family protein [Candidatus Bathyarchaeia archaeon]